MGRRLVAPLVAACAIAGCGGGSLPGVAPSAYVKSVCTTLGTWKSAIQTATAHLESTASATTSLAQGRGNYVAFVGSLVTATASAARGIRAAGAPAVTGGPQTEATLVSAFTRAANSLSQAATHAAAMPTTGAAAYQAAASGVSAEIRSALDSMTGVTPSHNPRLRAAAAKEPACQALQAGG